MKRSVLRLIVSLVLVCMFMLTGCGQSGSSKQAYEGNKIISESVVLSNEQGDTIVSANDSGEVQEEHNMMCTADLSSAIEQSDGYKLVSVNDINMYDYHDLVVCHEDEYIQFHTVSEDIGDLASSWSIYGMTLTQDEFDNSLDKQAELCYKLEQNGYTVYDFFMLRSNVDIGSSLEGVSHTTVEEWKDLLLRIKDSGSDTTRIDFYVTDDNGDKDFSTVYFSVYFEPNNTEKDYTVAMGYQTYSNYSSVEDCNIFVDIPNYMLRIGIDDFMTDMTGCDGKGGFYSVKLN